MFRGANINGTDAPIFGAATKKSSAPSLDAASCMTLSLRVFGARDMYGQTTNA